MSTRRILEIAQTCREWIEAQLDCARRDRLEREADPAPTALPETIDLPAFGERWRVVIETRKSTTVAAREDGNVVRLSGRIDDPSACRAALARWLVRRARLGFGRLLNALVQEHALPDSACAAVRVGRQRTRWGSRSPRGTISLNLSVAFLPLEQARYVLIHELCHAYEMNHSPRFWARVESCLPDWRAARHALRRERVAVPAWLDHV